MLVNFDIKTPGSQDEVRAQMIGNLGRGLPDVRPGEAKPEAVTIVASGPSARSAPLRNPVTMALNNSLKLFIAQGVAPTYWAACDPQEIVADFLPDEPPESTIYLVASKCHPKVFDKLKDRMVVVWHVDDIGLDLLNGRYAIATAVSITLCALGLAGLMGYRTMDVHGWDGCYIGGLDHALPQSHTADRIEVQFPDGRSFETTTTWAAEAQDAAAQLSRATYTTNIKGDGFIKAMVDHALGQREAA